MRGENNTELIKRKKLCIDIKMRFDGENIIYTVKHKLLGKIELNYWNYLYHIMRKHKESKMDKIFETLNNPDYIFKHSKTDKKNHYFEKRYGRQIFRVVVTKDNVKDKNRVIKTAYNCDEENRKDFISKRAYCLYAKNGMSFLMTSYDFNSTKSNKRNDFYKIKA